VVERLTVTSSVCSLTHGKEHLGLLRAIVVLSCVCQLAALLVPNLISGFLVLLQSVMEALFLPFRLLFNLALWLTTGRQISEAVSSVGHAIPPRDFSDVFYHDYAPAALLVAGLLLFVLAVGQRKKWFLWPCFLMHGLAGFMIGLPEAVLLFPSLMAEIVAFRKMDVEG
jgi:hypothetical protein